MPIINLLKQIHDKADYIHEKTKEDPPLQWKRNTKISRKNTLSLKPLNKIQAPKS